MTDARPIDLEAGRRARDAALAAAREQGAQEAIFTAERAVAASSAASVQAAADALTKAHGDHMTEIRAAHAKHELLAGRASHRSGLAQGFVAGALFGALGIAYGLQAGWFGAAAARQIEARGAVEVQPLTIREGEGDYTAPRNDGYARGREPADR